MADPSAAVSNESADSGSGPMMPGPDDIGPDVDDLDVEDLGRSRDYRSAEVRGKKLPGHLVRSFGLLNHMGNAREELAALAIAGHLSDITESDEAKAIRYRNRHDGTEHVVEREEGTIQKSRQSFVEDIRQRIEKKALTPGDREQRAEWSDDFERHYDRLRHAIDRLGEDDYLVNEGPAVESENKPARDQNGRKWSVEDSFRNQPEGDPQPLSVRCTGPEPDIDRDSLHVDALTELERLVAYQEDLHDEFTAGWKAEEKNGKWQKHQSKTNARKSHQWTAQNGTDRPQYVSVGRWRPEEIEEESLKGERAVFFQWIVFDIDADTKERCAELARQLLKLLSEHLTDEQLENIVCSFTGGTSVHVRVPSGIFGNRLFKNADAAAQSLSEFADRLCEGHPELREAIDDRLFHPRQMVRMIGSTYDEDTDPPDNSSRRPWLVQRLSLRPQVENREHATEIADKVLGLLRDRHLDISNVTLNFSGTRPVTVEDAPDKTPNTNRVVACTAGGFLRHGPESLWARSTCGRHQPFTLSDPTEAEYVEYLDEMLPEGRRSHTRTRAHTHTHMSTHTQELPHPPPKKSDTCSVAKQQSTGEYDRALQVEREGEKWGRDVDKPHLVGRNRAALTVALHRLTHSNTPWWDVRTWNREMSEPLPEAELRKTFRSAKKYV